MRPRASPVVHASDWVYGIRLVRIPDTERMGGLLGRAVVVHITERCKEVLHIPLCDSRPFLASRPGPTSVRGYRCRHLVTSDLFINTAKLWYTTQSANIWRFQEPRKDRDEYSPDLAQPGGGCGMIPPLVVISGSDLLRLTAFVEDDRQREGGTLGQRDGESHTGCAGHGPAWRTET